VCDGVDQDITETDFYNLSLTYVNGEGNLTSGDVYSTLISPSSGGESVPPPSAGNDLYLFYNY
jgi:hypothetical protein